MNDLDISACPANYTCTGMTGKLQLSLGLQIFLEFAVYWAKNAFSVAAARGKGTSESVPTGDGILGIERATGDAGTGVASFCFEASCGTLESSVASSM